MCLMSLVLTLTATARADRFPPVPMVPPAQWIQTIGDDLLVPGYTELANRAQRLDHVVQALCRAPRSDAIAQAQVQWRATAQQWRRLEALPIGPTLERRSMRRFDFWPTRPQQVEETIVRAPASLDSIGASAQGLPALEYLLFDDPRRLSTEPARCRYGMMITHALADEAQALATAWRAWDKRWRAGPDATTLKTALTDTLNATIGTLERLRVRKLEKPAQPRAGREPLFDAWRSGATRAHLLATFSGVRVVLLGGPSGIGLNSLLRGRGLHPLAVRLESDVGQVGDALTALPPKLPASDMTAVKQAANAVARLQVTLSDEVAKALDVTIGFNESDGD
jgi:uncharacterized protein